MKNHKLDRRPVIVLNTSIQERPGFSPESQSFLSRFVMMDEPTGDAKISFISFDLNGPLVGRPEARIADRGMVNICKFDGEFAWGVKGVSRAEFDIMENFRAGRPIAGEQMSFREMRHQIFMVAQEACNRLNDVHPLDEEGPEI